MGKPIDEAGLWVSDARKRISALLADSGSLRNVEFQVSTQTGDVLDCLVSRK
ncbi:MAG: hypothetical protein CBARDMAM_7171 [uncultured Caballeronia sp.]|nr:MAG: hypothetical protein CBARDMAM_7171 [uncultured Caballeronia sp.]